MNAKGFSRAIALSSVMAALVITPQVSTAQDEAVEEIIVTGSHIRKDTFTSSSPISLVDAAAIEGVGATNVGDLIARVPAVVAAVDGSSANVNEPSNSGISTTALRKHGLVENPRVGQWTPICIRRRRRRRVWR